MNRLVAFALLAVASEAAAQPGMTPYVGDLDEPTAPPVGTPPVHEETGFIGGGFTLGGDQFINAAYVVEGGLKLGTVPLWVRGLFARGSSFDFEGGGDLTRGMVGIETRGCASRALCGFVGLDLGYQQQTWSSEDEMTEHHDGVLIGPRAGLDAGGDNVRFRLSFEALRYDHHVSTSTGTTSEWLGGGGFTMTLVYRL